ncbi:MAG: GNAT family N-acetyltransferase [Lachnospiraceae bacterium]|nr:GNAT family N-acetyltransferase [Lachnospiraceae bacterium]
MKIVVYSDDIKSEVFRFTSECFEELGKSFDLYGRHSFYNDIDKHFERFWCLIDEGKVKGTVAITKIDDITAELKALYIDKSLRGLGWGYKLLDEAVSFARENDFSRVVLDSMSQYTDASRLYKRYGFTDIDRYNDNIYADVFMQMILAYTMEYKNPVEEKSSVRLIPYSCEYQEQYKSIYNKCYHEMREALDIKPFDFIQDDSFFDLGMENVYILLNGNEIIGSVALKGVEIDDLIVSPKYQGKGYGKKILLWALENIHSYHIILRVAAWNKRAISLYEKNGFEVIGKA